MTDTPDFKFGKYLLCYLLPNRYEDGKGVILYSYNVKKRGLPFFKALPKISNKLLLLSHRQNPLYAEKTEVGKNQPLYTG
ncbi:hypothetical protein CUU66_09750 [Peribacillus deserti]|uniref:Uncharacterized protein n=1 Tax=Peribacillus deserti TaxID=673318 RepID=A0A2N5M6R0_9BACI|nr:hypothetical protein CUU66_09750 [Peribacillus deserti]